MEHRRLADISPTSKAPFNNKPRRSIFRLPCSPKLSGSLKTKKRHRTFATTQGSLKNQTV